MEAQAKVAPARENSGRSSDAAQIVLFAILLLFFLQALSDFIESIYAFGLLVTAFTIQLAAVLLLFSPVALLFVRREPSRAWLIGLAGVATFGRLVEPLLDPGGKLVACGISVGAFMLLFPSLLAFRRGTPIDGWTVAWGLILAVMLSVAFRTAGSALDISEVGIYQLIAWVLAALAVLAGRLVWRLERREAVSRVKESLPVQVATPGSDVPKASPAAPSSHEERRAESLRSLAAGARSVGDGMLPTGSRPRESYPAQVQGGDAAVSQPPASTPRVVALCIGLASVVVTVYFTLMSPTVIARWTGYSYPAIVGVMVLAWVAFVFMLARPGLIGERLLAWPMLAAWNALFVLMLVLTIVPHQVALPAEQQAFPFYVPDASPWWQIPLYVMLILSPVVFADFVVYAHELSAEGPSMRQLGGGFALAALLLLVMVFLQVFTTIYDYARPIGPLFRDRFWLVYLLAGLGLALPVWLVGSKEVGPAGRRAQPAVPLRQPRREQRRETMHSGEETLHSGEETMRFVVRAAGGLAIVTGLALLLTAGRAPRSHRRAGRCTS